MALLRCQVNFSVIDPRGWVLGCDKVAHLDPSLDLDTQASAEAAWWVDSRNRCHGVSLKLGYVLSVFVERDGFWAVVVRQSSEDRLAWPAHF